ncbi:uncharacterized protein LOC105632986 isoform X2 [Jatropha curcas]|uniref:uncharacterized protein LOC105632986 isoform X2 n=1 Tax=Jatropha curcas TaxID=180498 RepID=UPI001894BC46|nr:uncharacterized protein LOC105632986 isoform X2 [Jatropha curcas]
MISALFCVVFGEISVIVTLLFRSPMRKVLMVGIDYMKRGRGQLVAKTVAATLFGVFSAILYSVMQIQKRTLESGVVNPTDEVLLAERLLEATLMDRLHYYIKELYRVRKEVEQLKRLK